MLYNIVKNIAVTYHQSKKQRDHYGKKKLINQRHNKRGTDPNCTGRAESVSQLPPH